MSDYKPDNEQYAGVVNKTLLLRIRQMLNTITQQIAKKKKNPHEKLNITIREMQIKTTTRLSIHQAE